MERWEKASASLVAALEEYQNSCASFYNSSIQEYISPEHSVAVTQIDSSLATLHPAMTQQLALSSIILTRTRNKLSSPLLRLPNEILAEILLCDLYSPSADFNKPKFSLERRFMWMVQRRHCLQGVCSSWRQIIISRGEFWSTVPLMRKTINIAVLEQWLPRAAGHTLYLGADTIKTLSSEVTKYLVTHMSRFSTIGIEAPSPYTINDLLNLLVGVDRTKALTELSIRRIPAHPRLDEDAILTDFTDAVDPPPVEIDNLLSNLLVLRLHAVQINWNSISFPDTLVELHLHALDFRTDSSLITSLQKLSHASQLRVLRIASIYASHSRILGTGLSTLSVSSSKITLPSLQSLYLEDLSPNTLKYIFTMITPGNYQLNLRITNKIHQIYDIDVISGTFIFAGLGKVLPLGQIHTLSIVGLQDIWLESDVFHNILKSLPTLKVLKLHGWNFMKHVWQAVQRPDTNNQPNDTMFPHLEQLYLNHARIFEEDGLKEMIESHLGSIQLVELRATNVMMTRPYLRGPYNGSEDIIVWLRSKVPNFYLFDHK